MNAKTFKRLSLNFMISLGLGLIVVVPTRGHGADHDTPPEIVVQSANVESPKNLETVVEFIHHALEGTDPKAGLIRKFLQNFNLPRHVKNALRVRNLNLEQDHANNVVFLFFSSHAMETASGPAYIVWAVVNGVPIQVALPSASFLLSLAVPGIDWGCVALQGLYLGSEEFRDVITKARVYTVTGVGASSKAVGFSDALAALIQHEPAGSYLQNQLERFANSHLYRTHPGDEHLIDLLDEDGTEIATLNLQTVGESVVLKHVTFNKNKFDFRPIPVLGNLPIIRNSRGNWSRIRKRLRETLKPYGWHSRQPFGWNIVDAVTIAYDHLAAGRIDSATAPYFVQSLEFWDQDKNAFVARQVKAEEHEHHHGHEDHDHDVALQTIELDQTLEIEKHQVRIHYFAPAIVRHAQPSFHLTALGAHLYFRGTERIHQLMNLILNPLQTLRSMGALAHQGVLGIQNGMIWMYHHPDRVRYHLKRGGLLVPLTLMKSGIIFGQTLESGAHAFGSFFRSVTKPVKWCREKLLQFGDWKQAEQSPCPGCEQSHDHDHELPTH